MVWSESIDVDQALSNDYTGNTNPLFYMIDGNSVQIELPASANIAAQRRANPVCLWYYEKLRIDFGREPSIVRRMAKPSNDKVRELFSEIGCIMEDASLIALVWGADDEIDVTGRFRKISDAHEKISQLLLQIESAS